MLRLEGPSGVGNRIPPLVIVLNGLRMLDLEDELEVAREFHPLRRWLGRRGYLKWSCAGMRGMEVALR